MNENTNLGLSMQRCNLCGKPTRLLNSDHCGYQRPERFAIYECAYCDLQFAEPLRSARDIYEHIYRNSAVLPGYARYHRYAEAIGQQSDPLSWLAQQECVFWFVRKVVLQQNLRPDDPVYEIGSGLGYLTFALRRAGISATGLDISETAVSAATKRFGPYYRVAPAGDISNIEPGTAAAVIMSELIEHVEKPEALLADIRRLLRPGGLALITTPNKSIFPLGAYWKTENPPVHYWWFSETSMRNMAARQNFDISFFDFTEFNAFKMGRIAPSDAGIVRQSEPSLDEHGTPLCHDATASLTLGDRFRTKRKRILCDMFGDARLAITRSAAAIVAQRSDSMGAILTRPVE
jgi:SAM-dependent methyltransferase